MLPGKFLHSGIFHEKHQKELYKKLKEGFIVLPWRERDNIYEGVLLIKNSELVGAMVYRTPEETPHLLGSKALNRITKVIRERRVHVFDAYEGDVTQILRDYPESGGIRQPSPQKLSSLLREFTGTITFQEDGRLWELQVDRGNVSYAWEIGGKEKGDSAVKTLLSHLPKTIENKISFKKYYFSLPPDNSEVTKLKKSVLDIVELLELKQDLENEKTKL